MTKAPRDEVRREVRKLLEESPSFGSLPGAQRSQVANDMVKVGNFLADKEWIAEAEGLDAGETEEHAPIERLREQMSRGLADFAGKDFEAGAVKQGVEQFKAMVESVDFPEFVSGLIKGVFQAVVDASIQQMEAYAQLLAAVSKTVEQFADEDIPDGGARRYVASRNPNAVQYDEATGRLVPGEEESPDLDVSDEELEAQVVANAKLEMAKSRQQLLATMVLLGINRIVITNGRINAKVVFDMEASDQAKRAASDSREHITEAQASSSTGWATNIVGGYSVSAGHKTTVKSSVDDTSESKAQVKAQLTGDVRLNFRSETFPLERMLDTEGMATLSARAEPSNRSGG